MSGAVEASSQNIKHTPFKAIVLAGMLSLGLVGCQNENETVGTLIGAGLGAWLGAEIGGHGDGRVIGAVIGTTVGASFGASVGRRLDEADRMQMEQAYYQALEYTPSGNASEWHNPDSGNHGSYEPQEAYQNTEGRYCREYTQDIWIGGEKHQGYGTACRQEDGSWEIISQ